MRLRATLKNLIELTSITVVNANKWNATESMNAMWMPEFQWMWMNEWVKPIKHQGINERMLVYVNQSKEWMWINEWMNVNVNEWKWMNECEWMEMNEWMWMNGNEWMNVNEWMDANECEWMNGCEWLWMTEMNAPDCLHPPAIVWEYSLTGAYQLDEAM